MSQLLSLFLLGSTKGLCDFKVKHIKPFRPKFYYRELININQAKLYHSSTIR